MFVSKNIVNIECQKYMTVTRASIEIASINHQALRECFRLTKKKKKTKVIKIVRTLFSFDRREVYRLRYRCSYTDFCLKNFTSRNDKREISVVLRKHRRDKFAT